MKWYSIKKYRPISGVHLFLFLDDCTVEVGHYLDYEFLHLDNIRIGNVTHFCIPEPVEIEE